MNLYFALGASLYIPANHAKLADTLLNPPPMLRSAVICLEDSIQETQLKSALKSIKSILPQLHEHRIIYLIRPRNPIILSEILQYPGIEHIDGFILPKFDGRHQLHYQNIAAQADQFAYLPTLETRAVFDTAAILELKQALLEWPAPVPCLRIGGNDLFNHLGLKRLTGFSLYQSPLRTLIDQLIIQFRPAGFELSAPVFDHIEDLATLYREVQQDLAYGLYAKTAIHPKQIPLIESLYDHFISRHIDMAEAILKQDSPAVFKMDGQMIEPSCHQNWAKRILNWAAMRQSSATRLQKSMI